ncbi:MAG: MerR family transcriptional regulator [Desulfobacteraceae bacterium]|nr:MerR family transcriptional regulator [Desulfobacteraceae bacterium]
MDLMTLENDLTMQQVSDRLRLPKSTIRYWEQKLGKCIKLKRTGSGQRRYTTTHFYILERVKVLKYQGKKIVEIKRFFDQERLTSTGLFTEESVELLARRIADLVRDEVSHFHTAYENHTQ